MNELECIELVNRYTDPAKAVEALVNEASRRWLVESDYIDDITAIIIFLDVPPPSDNITNDIERRLRLPSGDEGIQNASLSAAAIAWTLLAGASSGFLGGLCAIRGPPIILYFLRSPKSVAFTKTSQRATGACITATNVIMRVIYYAIEALTSSAYMDSTFVAQDWPLYVSVCTCSILGVFAGSVIFEKIKDSNTEPIKMILSVLLLLSGVSLIIPSIS